MCSGEGGPLGVATIRLNWRPILQIDEPGRRGKSMAQRDFLTAEEKLLVPESEELLYSTPCNMRGRRDKDPNLTGKVVVTSKNVYLLKRPIKIFGAPGPLTKEVLAIAQITGIDQTFENYLTVKSYHVRITRAGNEDVLYGLGQASAQNLIDHIQGQMGKDSQAVPAVAPVDPIEQLTRLADLLERGLVTREEFEAKKIQLLG